MCICSVMSQKRALANRRLPVGRSVAASGRNGPDRGTPLAPSRYRRAMVPDGDVPVNDTNKHKAPPAVHSAPPERDLEQKLKRHPDDKNLKADVGSDESMDASD